MDSQTENISQEEKLPQLLLKTSWVSIYQVNSLDLPEHQQKEFTEFFEGTVQRELLRLDIQRCKNIAPEHTQFYTKLEQLLTDNSNSWICVRRQNNAAKLSEYKRLKKLRRILYMLKQQRFLKLIYFLLNQR